MHILYFVAKKKQKGDTKEDIRRDVFNTLEEEGFCGDSGYFNNGGKGDWFVIGGRWSGLLQAVQLDNWNKKARELIVKKRGEKKDDGFITAGEIENNKKELQELWESLGGEGKNSWDRDTYNHLGFEDDVMLLDKKLQEALSKQNYKETEVAIMDDYIEDEMLLNDFLKNKENIGKYWICVVDYHY